MERAYRIGSQSVFHGSEEIRDPFLGDPWIHFCNGYVEAYLIFKVTGIVFC
jgi:hypothetical protein